MKKGFLAKYLLLASMLPAVAIAQTVNLTGKLTSKVTAKVVRLGKFEVTDDKGGWFGQGLEMQQFGGWDTPYEVTARLRVLSTNRTFQVRLDESLQISNQSNPAQTFRKPSVTLGERGGSAKPLVVGQNAVFKNPEPPVTGDDSVGYYDLTVSAYPPEGDFKSTVGTYRGVLSMTFEPVVTAP